MGWTATKQYLQTPTHHSRFLWDKAKITVLTAVRKKKQIIWKGTWMRFFQDYTQDVQEKRKIFDVRHLLQKNNTDYALRHQFTSPAEAKTFLTRIGDEDSANLYYRFDFVKITTRIKGTFYADKSIYTPIMAGHLLNWNCPVHHKPPVNFCSILFYNWTCW